MKDKPLLSLWHYAFSYCQAHGLTVEQIESWKQIPPPSMMSDEFFLEELAWCVYNAGMKEQVIRSKWRDIQSVFQFFHIENLLLCEKEIPLMMKPVFNHEKKVMAVIEAAKKIKKDAPIAQKIGTLKEEEILDYLESFPYIGKITKYHLARNIGLDVVKPDRHLVRLAQFLNYSSPHQLTKEISHLTGERVGFIDYILWQWLAWEGKNAYLSFRNF